VAVKEMNEKNGVYYSCESDDNVPSVPSTTAAKKQTKPSKKPASESVTGENVRKRSYVPRKGSGGYAVLIALLLAERDHGREELNKQELIESAQPFAEESMTKARPGSHFTAFNSVKTLITNELVHSHQSRNAFYRLTDAGRKVAEKLVVYTEEKKSCPLSAKVPDDYGGDDDTCSTTAPSSSVPERYSLPAGSFEIVLLVDTREQSSGVEQALRKTAIIAELLKNGISAEMRTLPVGDFVWVARRKQSEGGRALHDSPELLMDFVIERKRADDLSSSIVDGRFKEQKHRLLKCGVRKPTYLIEGLVRADYSVPYRNLLLAVTDSQIVDGFNIKTTLNHSETIAYLSLMTKKLSQRLASKSLLSCTQREIQGNSDFKDSDKHFMTFSEFEKSAKKITNFKVSEMFLKHLIQFSGMTVVKAKAITTEYKTLMHLLDAYDECQTDKQKEKLLAAVKFGNMTRSVGPVLSGKVLKYYSLGTNIQE
jgi:crossover junction endonuclease MUS81